MFYFVNTLIIGLLIFISCNGIYVPNTSGGVPTKTQMPGETKTLGWQESPQQLPVIHQNYSNIKLQQHNNADNLQGVYSHNRNNPYTLPPYTTPVSNIRPQDISQEPEESQYQPQYQSAPNTIASSTFPTASYDGYDDPKNYGRAPVPKTHPRGYDNPKKTENLGPGNLWNNRTGRGGGQDTQSTTMRTEVFAVYTETNFPVSPVNQSQNADPYGQQPDNSNILLLAIPGTFTTRQPPQGQAVRPYGPHPNRTPNNASYGGMHVPGVPIRPQRGDGRMPVGQQRPQYIIIRPQYPQFVIQPMDGPPTQQIPQYQPNTPHNSHRPQYNPLQRPQNQPAPIHEYAPNDIRIPTNYYSRRQPTRQQPPQEARSACPTDATGLFPYEASCNQFLNCHNGRSVIQNCAPGTLFNPQSLECDYPEKVHCLTGPQSRSARYAKLTATPQANCPPNFSGLIPHYGDCAKFIICNAGSQHTQNCPPGTLFDQRTNVCDHSYKVQCVNGQNAKEPSSQGQRSDNNYPEYQPMYGQQAVGREPPTNARQPQPLQGISYSNSDRFSAPHTQFAGVQPPLQQFRSTPSYESQQQVSVTPTCPQHFSGLMAHPSDCAKFLNCAHGMTHVQSCGPGTHFNPAMMVCDHIYNVKCGQGGSGSYQPPQQGPERQPSFAPQESSQRYNPAQQPPQSYNPPQQPSSYSSQRPPQNYNPVQQPTQNYNPSQQPSSPQPHQWSALPTQQTGYRTQWPQHGQYTPQGQTHDDVDQDIENLWSHPTASATTAAYETLTPAASTHKSSQWPPPFPTDDGSNDYVFEYEDLVPITQAPPTTPAPPPPASRPNLEDWCARKGFKCTPRLCISPSLVCNGQKDCANGKDELDCDLSLKSFIKTAGTKLAVKEIKKAENVTLSWCAIICTNENCKGFNYRKHDGTCYILDANVGLTGALIMLPMYDYYESQRQQIHCDPNNKYLCQNQKCIARDALCDGVNDCGDGLDEKGCTADAFDYKLRLVGGKDANSGRLEVQAFGKTGYVCDDMFGLRNADVACRELGFQLGAAEVRGNSFFAQDISPEATYYIMDDVVCSGNESSLRDCDFNGWGISNCQPQEIVGVVCKTTVKACPEDHWQCANNLECLPLPFVCDGVYDCADKSDEDRSVCEQPTKVRLTQGHRGRVEVLHNGMWGTVCDDDFNDDAAKVVCAQLNYNGSAKVVKDGQFGPGGGPIWLDQVFCRGNESALDDCIHWDWGEHNCEHAEDVGVICNARSTTFDDAVTKNAKSAKQMNIDRNDALLPEKCGWRSDAIFKAEDSNNDDDAVWRVIAAGLAKSGDYPWQASIRVQGKTKAAHWCGAVVIAQKYVLTAAHCLTGFSKGAYFISAGDYNVDRNEGTEQEAYIEDFITHPEFGHGNKMNNDIAVVRLKGNGFNITKDVQPICLPTIDMDYPVGLNCTISGFGSIESGKSRASRDLRAGWIPILSREVCRMPHVYGVAITPGMMCAGYMENGVDACDGDSGGPMACLHDGVFTLFGITSWGQHCGYANKPGVYVNVAQYRPWIEETMKKLAVV